MDLEKKIEELEKRIKELESNKKDSLSMFGKNHCQLGNSNSDLILKTKGLVKIQWGNKFINLLKGDKLNVDVEFIHSGSSIGSKEGVWIINGEEVWIKPKSGDALKILGTESGVLYTEQHPTPEEQIQALINLGFFVKSQQEIDTSQDKVVFSLADKALYIINNGVILPLIPTSNRKDEEQDKQNNYITYNNQEVIINGIFKIGKYSSSCSYPFSSNKITSENATYQKGFILEDNNGVSTLYIDNINVRNKENEIIKILPEFYFSHFNIIRSCDEESSDESEEVTILEENVHSIVLYNPNSFKEKDIVRIYSFQENEILSIDCEITAIEGEKIIVSPTNLEDDSKFSDINNGDYISLINRGEEAILNFSNGLFTLGTLEKEYGKLGTLEDEIHFYIDFAKFDKVLVEYIKAKTTVSDMAEFKDCSITSLIAKNISTTNAEATDITITNAVITNAEFQNINFQGQSLEDFIDEKINNKLIP